MLFPNIQYREKTLEEPYPTEPKLALRVIQAVDRFVESDTALVASVVWTAACTRDDHARHYSNSDLRTARGKVPGDVRDVAGLTFVPAVAFWG